MKSKLSLAPALIVTAFALASCGGGSDTSSTATEAEATATTEPTQAPAAGEKLERSVKVDIADYEYGPDPVRVQAGGKVTWLNEDSVDHTATADDGSFDTGEIESGKLKSETFKQPGVYTY